MTKKYKVEGYITIPITTTFLDEHPVDLDDQAFNALQEESPLGYDVDIEIENIWEVTGD